MPNINTVIVETSQGVPLDGFKLARGNTLDINVTIHNNAIVHEEYEYFFLVQEKDKPKGPILIEKTFSFPDDATPTNPGVVTFSIAHEDTNGWVIKELNVPIDLVYELQRVKGANEEVTTFKKGHFTVINSIK